MTRDWWSTRDAFELYVSQFVLDGRLAGEAAAARIDVLHVAVASVHGMGYLVTWNCAHIANATMRGRIEAICSGAGFDPPIIRTPIELVKEEL